MQINESERTVLHISIEVRSIGKADRIGSDETAQRWRVIASAEVGEACFFIMTFGSKTPWREACLEDLRV